MLKMATMRTPPGQRGRGFTLIELMIAIALLGVLIAAATPGFTQWIANTKVRTSAESIQNGLMLAKAEAIATNRKVEFALTNGEPTTAGVTAAQTGTNWVVRAATPGTTTYATFIQGRRVSDAGQGVQINSQTPSGCTLPTNGSVAFTGLGLLTPVPGSGVLLCFDVRHASSNRPLRITVERGGAIRMCDPGLSVTNTTMGCP